MTYDTYEFNKFLLNINIINDASRLIFYINIHNMYATKVIVTKYTKKIISC